MTANSSDAQKLWGYFGGDGGESAGNTLVRQAPNDAAPVVFGDYLFSEASGAPAVFVGNASISFTAIGDFTAGSPAGDANFVGNASFAFSTAGSFRAGAALLGSSSLSFTQTGDFRAASSLTGAATVAFNAAGTLNARASFQGSTSFAFATSGDFTAGTGGGAANFVGNASFSFSAAGDFVAGSAVAPTPELYQPGGGGGGTGKDTGYRLDNPIGPHFAQAKGPQSEPTPVYAELDVLRGKKPTAPIAVESPVTALAIPDSNVITLQEQQALAQIERRQAELEAEKRAMIIRQNNELILLLVSAA